MTDTSSPGSGTPLNQDAPQELSVEKATAIFVEYLTYDARNIQQMRSFVAQCPWVLMDRTVCQAVVKDPNCYNTLKQCGWWDTVRKHAGVDRSDPEDVAVETTRWLHAAHVMALAYETTDEALARTVDWPAWEVLLTKGSLYKDYAQDPDMFYRARAFVVLANRLGADTAPFMCAALAVLLPLDDMEATVGEQWTPLQKAQYGWMMEKSFFVGEAWPAHSAVRARLRQAQDDIVQWKSLVDEKALWFTNVVHDLNHGDLDQTIAELMVMGNRGAFTDTLDVSVGLDDSPTP